MIAEEVKDPRKNVPRAVFISLAISVVFYILVALVAIGLVGGPALSTSRSPLSYAISQTGSHLAVLLISIGGVLATASVLITSILGVSRVEYAMARKGDLPRSLSKVHIRYRTPYYDIWITGAIIVFLVLFVDVISIVVVSTFAQLFYYSIANVSAFRLKTGNERYPKYIPLLGLISCLALLLISVFFSPKAILIGIGGVAAGAVVWVLMERSYRGPEPGRPPRS